MEWTERSKEAGILVRIDNGHASESGSALVNNPLNAYALLNLRRDGRGNFTLARQGRNDRLRWRKLLLQAGWVEQHLNAAGNNLAPGQIKGCRREAATLSRSG